MLKEFQTLKEAVLRTLEIHVKTPSTTSEIPSLTPVDQRFCKHEGEQDDRIENTVSLEQYPLHPQNYRARTLENIKKMYRSGMNQESIVTQFNQEGTPTLSGRGKWHKGTVAKLIKGIKN